MTPIVAELSEREEQVVLLLADGFGVGEIAKRLGITPWTVKSHRENARRKLRASTTAHAVAIVVRLREVPA